MKGLGTNLIKNCAGIKFVVMGLLLSSGGLTSAETIAQEAASQNYEEVILLPVDINSADAETIAEVLDGVGMRRAEAIVSFREENGPFQSLEDLILVNGVGESTIAKNKDKILFD